MQTETQVVSDQMDTRQFYGKLTDSTLIQRGDERLLVNYSVEFLSAEQFVRSLPEMIQKFVRMEIAKQRSAETKVIIIKDEEYGAAKERVLELVKRHKDGIGTAEIIEELSLDPEVVLRILSELKEADKIGKVD